MELFTVDYALNYEGWTYDSEVAPYNVYTLDQFTIKVRRNDFFLLLYITNACEELVFAGRIYTIDEYLTKVKKNLTKWKCKVYSTVDPTPSNNLEIVPSIIDLIYNQGDTIDNQIIATVFNETVTQLTTSSIEGLEIFLVSDYLRINATPNPLTTEPSKYVETLSFIGNDSGKVIQVTINIEVLPEESVILMENSDKILLETNDFINLEI